MTLRQSLLSACLLAALPMLADARGLDVRDMLKLDRVSSPVLSPDGSLLVLAQRKPGADGKPETGLYVRNLLTRDIAEPRRLTPEGWNVNSPSFSRDGRTLYFLSAKGGTQQVYAMPVSGGEPKQLSDHALDVGSYKVSPDGGRIAVSLSVYSDCGADLACTVKRLEERGQAKASGVLHDRLFVRHWDTWSDGRHNQLFWTTPGGAELHPVGLNEGGAVGDVPSKPFGDAGEYNWAPDSRAIVFSARVGNRGDEPWSTDFDLYLYRPGQPLRNLTLDDRSGSERGKPNALGKNPGTDTGPVFSADGKTLYYRAMPRAGFEADRYALMARDMATGRTREIAPGWDRSPSSMAVSKDGKSLYVAAQDTGRYPLFRVEIASGKVDTVFDDGTVTAFSLAGDTVALTRNTMQTHDQAFVLRLDGQGATQARAITTSAGEQLADVRMGAFEQFSFAGWDGNTVHGYVVKPWNYEEGRKYPVAFLIHGGPQGSFGNGWSYRWNPQTYAGQGYAVVMIDFHGSTGYGQAFTDAISGHWGDRPLEDLQKGWAAAQQRYAFLDGDRACALGASYGGYMVNWIAGNWTDAFKCLVNHNGVFDTRSMGLVTEELWFTEWEFGGTVAQNPEAYERFNPARHIHKWKVPMLVVAGQNDFRVPLDQSLSTFTALQRAGIESKLLYFPDENHWVLKPDNSILWHDTVNAWLKQHIGQ